MPDFDFIEPFEPWWVRYHRENRSCRAAIAHHLGALVVLAALVAAVVYVVVS